MNTPYAPSNTPLPQTRLSLATESGSEERLRSTLKETIQEDETLSSKSALNSNIQVSVEDHDSSVILETAGGHEVDQTVKQVLQNLPELAEELGLPVHAPPLEPIAETDAEPTNTSLERRLDKKEDGGKDPAVETGEKIKETPEEQNSNMSTSSKSEEAETTQHSKSPQPPNKPKVLITTSNYLKAPLNSPTLSHNQKTK